MTVFEPHKVLKHISNALLREYFSQQHELQDLPWDTLTEHKVQPIANAIATLPAVRQGEIQQLLLDVHSLSSDIGMAVLLEHIPKSSTEQRDEFEAQKGNHDRVMLTQLRRPEVMQHAVLFARADALSKGRHWYCCGGLPEEDLVVDDVLRSALACQLSEFYTTNQRRGRLCHIVHEQRQDGSDYFFAYLDNYANKRLGYDGDDPEPGPLPGREAFENIFVYHRHSGTLDLYATGGRKVYEPLQKAFCKGVFNKDTTLYAITRPVYALDHLLQPDYPLTTETSDCVTEARITRIRIKPRGGATTVELKVSAGSGQHEIYRAMERLLCTKQFRSPGVKVLSASFQLQFEHEGRGRAPVLSFDVSVPHTCTLKGKPDRYRVVGERCLKRWGITNEN